MPQMMLRKVLNRSEYLSDPYPIYRRLRTDDPVHWNQASRLWTVTRYDDVTEALRHPSLSSRRSSPDDGYRADGDSGRVVRAALASWLLRIDPPSHTRIRRLLDRALSATVAGFVRQVIERRVNELLDALPAGTWIDAVRDFTIPLSSAVTMEVIGVPSRDHVAFKEASDAIAAFAANGSGGGRGERAHRHLLTEADYLYRLIERRRRDPADDLLSRLLSSQDQYQVSDDEISSLCALVLLAGHETTGYALANGLNLLLQHGDQLELLAEDAGMIPNAVEELLRCESPLHGLLRIAVEDVELSSKRVERGQVVLVWLAAANRDPSRFSDPERFDVTRNRNHHVAFGLGIHRCPGAPLARLVMRIALTAIVARRPRLRGQVSASEWQGNVLFRNIKALPILV